MNLFHCFLDNKVVLNNWLDTHEMPLGNCAVSKHTSQWKVADCNEQHPALCQIKHNGNYIFCKIHKFKFNKNQTS